MKPFAPRHKKEVTIKTRIYVSILWLCVLCCGCATTSQAQKELAEKNMLQAENYQRLITDMATRKISEGQSSSAMRGLYGEPEHIYQSTSSLSTLEVWTYDLPREESELFNRPIRLYFNNGKLSSWSN